jgi:hypothetical protein
VGAKTEERGRDACVAEEEAREEDPSLLSPGTECMGAQSAWRAPSRSQGAYNVRRAGKPLAARERARWFELVGAGAVAQLRCLRVEEARTGGMTVSDARMVGAVGWVRERARRAGSEMRSLASGHMEGMARVWSVRVWSVGAVRCEPRRVRPRAVTPGRACKERDRRAGMERRVVSLKSSASKAEIARCWRDGRRGKRAVKPPCSRMAPGWA